MDNRPNTICVQNNTVEHIAMYWNILGHTLDNRLTPLVFKIILLIELECIGIFYDTIWIIAPTPLVFIIILLNTLKCIRIFREILWIITPTPVVFKIILWNKL